MNHSVYVFGELGNGYTQYPDDYTRDFFKCLHKRTAAHSQLAIHRDGELIYYAYTRKLSESVSNDQFIGMCCVFNGIYTDKYKELFEIFENSVTSLVVYGDLLQFTDKGEVTSRIDKLHKSESHCKAFCDYLSLKIGILFSYFQKLPPINYSISTSEIKKMSIDDDSADISDSIRNYSTVLVAKNDGYNTASLSSYAGKLKSLNEENCSLSKKNSELENTITSIRRQQKRLGWVFFMFLLFVIGAFVSYFILKGKNDDIDRLNNEVTALTLLKYNLENDNNSLRKDLNTTNNKLKNTVNELYDTKYLFQRNKDSLSFALSQLNENDQIISNLSKMPLIVTDVQVANSNSDGTMETGFGGYLKSCNSMYLMPKIKYVGAVSGRKTIYVKLYAPYGLSTGDNSPSGYSYCNTFDVDKGKNEIVLNGWGGNKKGQWYAGNYRWEFYCDGICIGKQSFVVH